MNYHPMNEVAHLNSLLTDSYAATSALFQLLRDHNIPVGSPELIKAREKVEVEMQTLRTANAGLIEKVKRLEEAGDALERDKQLLKKILADIGVVGSMGFGSTVKWAQAKGATP